MLLVRKFRTLSRLIKNFHRLPEIERKLDAVVPASTHASPDTSGVEILDRLCALQAKSREEIWCELINRQGYRSVLEVGVWRGEFAEAVLKNCPGVTTYYMVDPWRQLADWNKPFNLDARALQEAYAETMTRTEFADDRRVVLRGTTLEVIHRVADASVDFAYIDGDHTLRGITVDLLRCYQKVRFGGVIGGDDYGDTIWQHDERFEPTLVAPYAAYFAEAVGNPMAALPFRQFAIHKTQGFRLIGQSRSLDLRSQVRPAREPAV